MMNLCERFDKQWHFIPGEFASFTEAALASGELDLVAFGRPFIANPDLVERMKNDWPIALPDRSTFYGNSGEKGYVDYPFYTPAQ